MVRIAIFGTALTLACLSAAQACNVPVFRFALEHWRPDPYRVTVFHRGPLSDADQALIATLEEQPEQSPLNLALRTVDVAELDAASQELFAARLPADLPALVAQYPAPLRMDAPIWSAPLKENSLATLVDSPVRTELVKRLANGQTAVWMLLESGQAERDQQAAKLLDDELTKLAQKLKLPELTDAPEDNLLAATPLRISFSALRVPRSAAEKPLVDMLLHSESDLLERSDPMIFPVFGRGRALYPLIGAGITAENIHDSAAFLVGACSCEVKDQNPGFDLLLAADWDVLLMQDGVPLLAAATRNPAPNGEPELIPIPRGSANAEASTSVPTVRSNSLFFIGLLFAGAVMIIGLVARR